MPPEQEQEDWETRSWAKEKPRYKDMTGVVLDGVYELQSKEAEGGSGEIWRARDLSLGTEWMVKLLPAEFSQHQLYMDALLREAKVTASLPGGYFPSVVRCGISDGVAFYVMEALWGADLEELLEDRYPQGMPLSEALPLLEQILEALNVAHKAGVIHRDIKPRNIFVETSEGRHSKIRILDFGVAKASKEVCATLPLALRAGTRGWMAPELTKSIPDRETAAVDVFAVGLVAYQMILGRDPFAGIGPRNRYEKGLELPPLHKQITGRRAWMTVAISDVLSRAVCFDVGKRYSDAGSMLKALRYASEFRPRDISIGTVLNKSYRVLSKIDEGGMGAVYEVEDVHREIREEQVVKILAPPRGCSEKESDDLRERFRRECTALYGLQHPAIPHIYGNASHQDLPFLVMERARGETLDKALPRVLAEGGWPAVLDIANQLASALDAVHEAGIVHRDIKPTNIIVDAQDMKATLLDFGVVRVHDTQLTAKTDSVGTPGFCAPEQLSGRGVSASDQWSFAACLYAVLADTTPGALPGEAEAIDSEELAFIVEERLLNGMSIPPFEEHRSVVEVPQSVARAINRAMSPDVAGRYDSVSAFVQAMGAGLVQIEPPLGTRPVARAKKRARKRPRLAVIALAVVLAVAGSLQIWEGVREQGQSSKVTEDAP